MSLHHPPERIAPYRQAAFDNQTMRVSAKLLREVAIGLDDLGPDLAEQAEMLRALAQDLQERAGRRRVIPAPP